MSQELLYTSAPRGLKPGSRGFCTVLSTQGMAAPLATALEGLSGYRPVFPTGDPRAGRNPIVYSHVKLQSGGRTWNVLSRIADFGLDYSQRSNKLAHHVVLDRSELQSGGPANLLSTPDFIRTDWDGEPQLVATRSPVRETRPRTGICVAWQEMTGDAGWAGVLAESFLHDPDRIVILLFAPGQDLLPLFAESISLLPPERRWEVTFSTYFTGLAAGTTCVWRGMVKDSKEAHDSQRFVGALRLDITEPSIGRASGASLVELSRHGRQSSTPPLQTIDSDSHKEIAERGTTLVDPGVPRESEATHSRTNDVGGTIRIAHVPPRLTRVKHRSDDALNCAARRPPRRTWIWVSLATTLGIIAILPSIRHYRRNAGDALTQPTTNHSNSNSQPPHHSPHSATSESTANTRTTAPVKALTSHDAPTLSQTPKPVAISESALDTREKQGAEALAKADAAAHSPPIPAEIAVAKNEANDPAPKPRAPKVLKLPLKDVDSTTIYAHSNSNEAIEINIMKPEWISYSIGPPVPKRASTAARWTIFTRDAFEEKVQVATLTPKEGGAVVLKSTNDEGAKWLAWCRLQVIETHRNLLLEEIAFTQFPVNSSSLDRTIGKPTKWELPQSAPIEETHLPQLVLGRVKIVINEQEYSLDPMPSGTNKWSLPLAEYSAATYGAFACKNAPTSQLRLLVSYPISETRTPGVESKKSAIRLEILGKEAFLAPIKNELETRLSLAINDVPMRCKAFDMELCKLVDSQLRAVTVARKGLSKGPVLDFAISNIVKRHRDDLLNKPDVKRMELLEKVVAGIDTISQLFSAIRDFQSTEKSLDSVTVTSARVHYEVFDVRSPKSAVEIDVIRFDDNSGRDTISEGAKDPAGGDK